MGDTEDLKVKYPSIFQLMRDLRGMAENNAAYNRKLHLHRESLIAANAIYADLYANEDGSLPHSKFTTGSDGNRMRASRNRCRRKSRTCRSKICTNWTKSLPSGDSQT